MKTNIIIYEEQFKIKAFLMYLILSKIGIFIIITSIFFMGFHVKTVALIFLLIFIYYKYENVKRHEILKLFLFDYIRKLSKRNA